MGNMIVCGKKLDSNQMSVILDNSDSLLVVAGAGSGKTLTIVGKIKYLIENNICSSDEILCISFTNDATNNLKEKLSDYNIDIMTFHKLAINILKENNVQFELSSENYLEYIIHEFFYGIIFENVFLMKIVLKYFKENVLFNIEKKYRLFIEKNKKSMFSFERVIARFIRLFKANGFKYSDFYNMIKRCFFSKEKYFLLIAFNLLLIYETELKSYRKFDFDDLLSNSTNIIKNNGLVKKYKYIIIDEFQDTSYTRYRLIKEIIDKTHSKIVVVGDDYQSIFGFTGCDLKIFVKFETIFLNSKVIKLENTYRNSQELIDVCSKFIMKNKIQIRKKLRSNRCLNMPIKIVYNSNINNILDHLNGTVMILGRNNNDIYRYLNDKMYFMSDKLIYIKNKNLDIKYYTVHCSKGLEADNVILLNVIDDNLGFPNKIENEKILRYVSDGKEIDEERRLFYVALTRTRNYVYLITEKNRESVFIKEIIKYGYKNIEIIKKNK